MKDDLDLSILDSEGMELVDLGDAAVETKQISPANVYQDSTFGFGLWP